MGGTITRKFICPFCGFTKNFYGKEARRYKKKVIGLTCPGCGKKVTADDIKRKKGKGPKPKEERRKRVKKEVVKENPKVEPLQSGYEPIEWRTRTPSHTNPWESQHPGARSNRRGDYTGWQQRRPLQPTDRTLGEAVMSSQNIRPSGPIPYENLRSEEKLENKEYREIDIEKLEKHEKKLALMIVRLDRVEVRMGERVKELDIRLTELDSKLQALSTLTSHMEMILEEARRKMTLIKGYNRR